MSRNSSPHRLPPAPAQYTEDDLEYLEEQNEEQVTQRHLFCALDYIVTLLNAKDISYGIMGGMSMILLGNQRRTTTDVDVAVDVKPKDLLTVLEEEPRVYRPRPGSVAGSGVARIFVLTGPSYGENVKSLAVEVDLIISGNKGAPAKLDGTTNILSVQTESGKVEYNILNLQHLFVAKLRSFRARESQKDFDDLVWMCTTKGHEVEGFAPKLDQAAKENFAYAYAKKGADDKKIQSLCKLLGVSLSRPSSSGSNGSICNLPYV